MGRGQPLGDPAREVYTAVRRVCAAANRGRGAHAIYPTVVPLNEQISYSASDVSWPRPDASARSSKSAANATSSAAIP